MSVGDKDPFLFHDASQPGRAETHVLVIGVGEYPYLPGGAKFDEATGYDELGQLASPPRTATDIAEWFRDQYRNSSAPLGTVSLLVSEANENAKPRATIDNICAAIKRWFDRNEGDPKNFPIFYFCGHGLASGMLLALLAEDFGAHKHNKLDGALDFERFYEGMAILRSKRQLFFVDACRTNSPLVVRAGGTAGRVPILPDETAGWSVRPVFYSTLKGLPAYGRTRSHFGEALLAALNGMGGDNSADNRLWSVSTTRLHEAIQVFMSERVEAGLADPQIAPIDNQAHFIVHELSGPPVVPVVVQCDPPKAQPEATLTYGRCGSNKRDRLSPNGANKGWSLQLQCGMYEIEASFEPVSEYKTARDEALVHPPSRNYFLKVTP